MQNNSSRVNLVYLRVHLGKKILFRNTGSLKLHYLLGKDVKMRSIATKRMKDLCPNLQNVFFPAASSGIHIRVAQNLQANNDTSDLSNDYPDTFAFRSLDFKALVGAGILHTKLWIVDRWGERPEGVVEAFITHLSVYFAAKYIAESTFTLAAPTLTGAR